MSDELTWTCHVCGRERPDALIKVASCTVGFYTRNVRYCADSVKCGDEARRQAEWFVFQHAQRSPDSALTDEERKRLDQLGFGPTLADIDSLETA